jgi:hypothetical protein
LVADILLAIGSRPDVRVWKNATGVAKIDDRVIKFGLKGSADILGILAPSGRFLAIECKVGRDTQSPYQKNFQLMIETMGGLYILARSVSDVKTALPLATKKRISVG